MVDSSQRAGLLEAIRDTLDKVNARQAFKPVDSPNPAQAAVADRISREGVAAGSKGLCRDADSNGAGGSLGQGAGAEETTAQDLVAHGTSAESAPTPVIPDGSDVPSEVGGECIGQTNDSEASGISKQHVEEQDKKEAGEIRKEAEAEKAKKETRAREAEDRAKKEAEEKAKKEAEEKAKKEAEEKAKTEAEEKAKKEAEEKVKKETEEKATKEAVEKDKKEAEEKDKKEAQEKANKE